MSETGQSGALLPGPINPSGPLTSTGWERTEVLRQRGRRGEALIKNRQNEHEWPEERDDDERSRGVTRCRRCDRTLAIDGQPRFTQRQPCTVLS